MLPSSPSRTHALRQISASFACSTLRLNPLLSIPYHAAIARAGTTRKDQVRGQCGRTHVLVKLEYLRQDASFRDREQAYTLESHLQHGESEPGVVRTPTTPGSGARRKPSSSTRTFQRCRHSTAHQVSHPPSIGPPYSREHRYLHTRSSCCPQTTMSRHSSPLRHDRRRPANTNASRPFTRRINVSCA